VHEVERFVKRKVYQTSFRNVYNASEGKRGENVVNVYRPSIQDPKQTPLQDPGQGMQPQESRKADVIQSRPIITEDQQPAIGRSAQHLNIERLPFQRSQPHGDYRSAGGRGYSGRI
jgi:hypothetical protein